MHDSRSWVFSFDEIEREGSQRLTRVARSSTVSKRGKSNDKDGSSFKFSFLIEYTHDSPLGDSITINGFVEALGMRGVKEDEGGRLGGRSETKAQVSLLSVLNVDIEGDSG
jgi:hypothetical protein